MDSIEKKLRFSKSHEWVRVEEDGSLSVGISDHAQDALGDVVFVELPELDSSIVKGQDVCVIESVKAASDIYSPVTGTIKEINNELIDIPEKINEMPYETWIYKISPSNESEIDDLMSFDDYSDFCASNG